MRRVGGGIQQAPGRCGAVRALLEAQRQDIRHRMARRQRQGPGQILLHLFALADHLRHRRPQRQRVGIDRVENPAQPVRQQPGRQLPALPGELQRLARQAMRMALRAGHDTQRNGRRRGFAFNRHG